MKTVIFVNGVGEMDNYLFNYCKNLKTVWWKGRPRAIKDREMFINLAEGIFFLEEVSRP